MKNKILSLALFPICLGGTGLSSADATTEDQVLAAPKANFAVADANSDGVLSDVEFVVLVDANADDDFGRSATIRRFGAYKRAFKKVDADENGQVTWEEFVAAQ